MSTDENSFNRFSKAGFGLLISDAGLALTLAQIASDADEGSNKRLRNLESARRAYETISHLRNKIILTDTQEEQLNGKLAELKTALKRLGEDI